MRAAIRVSLALGLAFGLLVPAAAAQDVPSAGLPVPVLESLAALGAHPDVLAAAEDGDLERNITYLRPVNDLDGDGLPDVLAVAHTPFGEERALVLTARRGIDGAELWTQRLSAGFWAIMPAQVGPQGENGLLVISYTGGFATGILGQRAGEDPWGYSNVGTAALQVLALDSAGEPVWSRAFDPGYYTYGPEGVRLAQDLAILAGTLEANGTATDLLLGLYNRTPDGETLEAAVLDGADGSTASQLDMDIAGAWTQLLLLDDLTGDGLDDYGVFHIADEAEAGTLHAVRGSDSAPLWTATVPDQPRLWITPAGDTTGDGRSDVLVSPTHYAYDVPAEVSSVLVLDGGTGAEVLSVAGDHAWRLGDATGDGRADIGVVTVSREADAAGAHYAAYTGNGDALYEQQHVVEPGAGGHRVEFGHVGDVDGDGVLDLGQSVILFGANGGRAETESLVVSGRTGALLRDGLLDARSSGASFDGVGDDFVSTTAWGGSSRDITVLDGLTGATLWQTRLRTPGDSSSDNWAVADLDGDGRADLVVNVRWSRVEYDLYMAALFPESSVEGYVLSGADGSVLWQTDDAPEPPSPPAISGTATIGEPFSWEGSAVAGATGAAPGVRACSSDDPVFRCEHVLVELTGPPGAATGAIELSDFNELVTDLDLYVYESDEHGTKGDFVTLSGNWFDTPGERVEFPLVLTAARPARFYLVEVVYYASTGIDGYTGTAELLN